MFVRGLLTVLCTAGIAFYLRFLVVLGRESTPRRISYWARLRLGSGENAIAELQQRKKTSNSRCLRTGSMLAALQSDHARSKVDEPRKGGFRCRSKKYPRNNWQNSYTIITRRLGQILAVQASQTLRRGSRYHDRKNDAW